MNGLILELRESLPCVFSASSEIPESVILREIIFVFQGIEGKYIRYDATKDRFSIDSKVRIYCHGILWYVVITIKRHHHREQFKRAHKYCVKRATASWGSVMVRLRVVRVV